MRTFDLNWMVKNTISLFAEYAYPLICKILTGEVQSITVNLFTEASSDRDVFAHTKLKNKEIVSVYRIDIYLNDVLRLCRQHKIFLCTEDVYRIMLLWYVLQPLYTAKFIESPSKGETYDSLYCAAADHTCQYLIRHFHNMTSEERMTLEILKYTAMVDSNHTFDLGPNDNPLKYQLLAIRNYKEAMLRDHLYAYREAVQFKAVHYQVDPDGFMMLERCDLDIRKSRIVEYNFPDGDSLGFAINPKMY